MKTENKLPGLPSTDEFMNLLKANAEMDENIRSLDIGLQRQNQDLKDLAKDLTHILQQKPDFSDLEAIAHKIHTKADNERVSELFGTLKKEIVDTLNKIKKDQRQKKQQKLVKVEEVSTLALEEAKKSNDKILKLANQFDKELVERDK